MPSYDGHNVAYPVPYSVAQGVGRGSYSFSSLLDHVACSVTVEARENGWIVSDSFGNQFVYVDPTDVLHAVALHLELPPINPLSVLPQRG
ncbi:MAG: hypothetical protein AMXMBFR61_07990 [Fimbriimonadales bacterium]